MEVKTTTYADQKALRDDENGGCVGLEARRPVTYADFRRAVADAGRAGCVRPSEWPVLPRRVGPPPPLLGPVFARVGRIDGYPWLLIPPLEKKGSTLDADSARRAFVDALWDAPPLTVNSSPQDRPGLGGQRQTWTPPGGAVAVCGGSAASVAAATALLTAWAGAVGPTVLGMLPVVNLGVATPTEVFKIIVPDSRSLVGDAFTLEVSSLYALAVLQFSIEVSGWQAEPLFNASPIGSFPLNLSAVSGESVVLKAMCLDANAAFLLQPRIDGWTRVDSSDDEDQNNLSRVSKTSNALRRRWPS